MADLGKRNVLTFDLNESSRVSIGEEGAGTNSGKSGARNLETNTHTLLPEILTHTIFRTRGSATGSPGARRAKVTGDRPLT